MSHMSYNRVNGRRCHGSRGFRLNSKRFSVQGLRARFVYLFRLLSSWRFSYLKSLKKSMNRNSIKRNSSSSSSSRRSLVMEKPNYMARADSRFRSFGRSNSFYSEAIADCLEFIKRSSISVDQKPLCQR